MIWRLLILAALCLGISRAEAQIGLPAGFGQLYPQLSVTPCSIVGVTTGTMGITTGTMGFKC